MRLYSDSEIDVLIEDLTVAAEEAIEQAATEAARVAALASLEREMASLAEAQRLQGENSHLKQSRVKAAVPVNRSEGKPSGGLSKKEYLAAIVAITVIGLIAAGIVVIALRIDRPQDTIEPKPLEVVLLRTLSGHTGFVESVAYSPDGRFIASGSWDSTIKIWDSANGALLRTLSGHTSGVWSVAYSPDGRFIASGSYDNTIKIWDSANGALLRTLSGHTICVNSVAYSPDGRFIASGGSDGTIKIWDSTSGAQRRRENA
jgi:WD40 repeat protein